MCTEVAKTYEQEHQTILRGQVLVVMAMTACNICGIPWHVFHVKPDLRLTQDWEFS